MDYKAVVFDLDGTLLDTYEDVGEAMNRALKKKGFPVHPLNSFKTFLGSGAEQLVARALPAERRDAQNISTVLTEFRSDYDINWNINTKPYPGVIRLLRLLGGSGLKLGILSNKPHEILNYFVEEFLTGTNFSVVLGHRRIVPPKPDPAGAFEAAKILDLQTQDIIYIGDTAVDMETAIISGMFPIGVAWGFRPVAELIASGAKAILSQPLDLLPILNLKN